MPDRTLTPHIKDATEFEVKLPPCDVFHLDNKIPVYHVHSDEQETLQLEWVFEAGTWYESSSLIAITTNILLKNGTKQHTSEQLNEMIEYYGAFLSTRCTHEFASLTLHCLEKHLTHLLPIMQEIITEAVFPENELEIYQQNGKQKLIVNLEKSDFVANQLIEKYIFGEYHPYGRYTTMEAYDALQRDSLYAFYKAHYSFDQCKIFLAGKIPGYAEQILNDFFGKDDWNKHAEASEDIAINKQKDYPMQPALEKKYRIANDPDGVQGAIRIARPFPNRYHPDVPKMQVLNTIFGGYFGSRLMSNIREDKGYTYGIYSALYPYNKAGMYNILTEVGKDVCEPAVVEIYKEMALLCKEPVPDDELKLVRNYLIGGVLGDLDGAFQVIRRWKNLILSGLDENYFYNTIQTIRTISTEELQQLAQKYYVPEDFYELVVV